MLLWVMLQRTHCWTFCLRKDYQMLLLVMRQQTHCWKFSLNSAANGACSISVLTSSETRRRIQSCVRGQGPQRLFPAAENCGQVRTGSQRMVDAAGHQATCVEVFLMSCRLGRKSAQPRK